MTSKFIIACGLVCCAALSADSDTRSSLKEFFKDDFLIGAAVNQTQFNEKNMRDVDIIKTQFNSITPENILKWESVHPMPYVYDFEASDRFVEFGEKNRMFIVGHTLVWHSQTPKWVFEEDNGEVIDRDILLKRLQEHIHTVVGRYKGRIHGWDVVNEALNDNGTLRESPWMKIIGEDFIIKTFQFVHEADPDAQLYYNDYGLECEPKRSAAIDLVRKLQSNGIPITAIGLQEHITLDWPSIQQIEDTIIIFAELNLKVHITELDINVLPPAWDYSNKDLNLSSEAHSKLNPYQSYLPTSINQELARRYEELFSMYLKHPRVIERVTFWGVTDRDSWLNDIPIKGRTSYPLLFDRSGQTKSAFDAIMSLKKQ